MKCPIAQRSSCTTPNELQQTCAQFAVRTNNTLHHSMFIFRRESDNADQQEGGPSSADVQRPDQPPSTPDADQNTDPNESEVERNA